MFHVNIQSMANEKTTGRRYRGRDPEQRKRERRERFVAAGRRVFGDSGFRGATVRGLCAEAGLTERYFYESFANTEALLAAVYREVAQRLYERVVTAMGEAPRDPESIARAALTAYFEFLRAEPDSARVLLVEIFGVSAEIDALYRDNTEAFSAMLAKLINNMAPPPAESQLDAELLAAGLIGVAVYSGMRWVLAGYPEPTEQIVANCLAIYSATAGSLTA